MSNLSLISFVLEPGGNLANLGDGDHVYDIDEDGDNHDHGDDPDEDGDDDHLGKVEVVLVDVDVDQLHQSVLQVSLVWPEQMSIVIQYGGTDYVVMALE